MKTQFCKIISFKVMGGSFQETVMENVCGQSLETLLLMIVYDQWTDPSGPGVCVLEVGGGGCPTVQAMKHM